MKSHWIALLAIGLAGDLRAHSGGLDSKGGHMDRKTGTYHYHRTPSEPVPPAAATSAPTPISPRPAPPAPRAQPSGDSRPRSTTSELATSPLAKVAIGMTRAQVEAVLGKPNIVSENAWLYSEHGWVRFRGNTVFSIEAK